MVKGLSRRVVLVKSPDPQYFEEAIFIIRDDAAGKGITSQEILRQAQEAAYGYAHSPRKRLLARLPAPVFILLGAAGTDLIWLITSLI